MSGKTDSELVAQYKDRGDINVLGQLYGRYMEMVYGVCLKYFKEREEAKDAVIHIFEELVSKLRKYEISNFKSWLYQLSKNHCLMKLRGNKTRIVSMGTEFMQLEENGHPDNGAGKEMQLEQMGTCIEQLPPEQKQAIQLFYLKQKCYKEVAAITGSEIGKVRSAIQNGRRNLKICMEKKGMQKV